MEPKQGDLALLDRPLAALELSGWLNCLLTSPSATHYAPRLFRRYCHMTAGEEFPVFPPVRT